MLNGVALEINDRNHRQGTKQGPAAPPWRPPKSSKLPWILGFVLMGDALVAAFAPLRWFPAPLDAHLERVRISVGLASPKVAPSHTRANVERVAPRVAPVAASWPSPPASVTNAAASQSPPLSNINTKPAENPYIKPGTIYRCKSYSGAVFWSAAHCSQHKALIDRIASVPVGMPFTQQIDIAAREAGQLEQTIRREQREGERLTLCTTLQHERDEIWKRSGSGAGYVPMDVLGRDQSRWRQIEDLLNRNACRRPQLSNRQGK